MQRRRGAAVLEESGDFVLVQVVVIRVGFEVTVPVRVVVIRIFDHGDGENHRENGQARRWPAGRTRTKRCGSRGDRHLTGRVPRGPWRQEGRGRKPKLRYQPRA
eukprot:3534231-Pyramimonas_sp.AAC.1